LKGGDLHMGPDATSTAALLTTTSGDLTAWGVSLIGLAVLIMAYHFIRRIVR
jgi:hypothetical protein